MDLGLFILRLTRMFRQRPSRRWLMGLVLAAVLVAVCLGVEAMGWWPDWLSAERGPRIPMTR